MLKSNYSNAFRKDMKRLKKRRKSFEKLNEIVSLLLSGSELPASCKDHPLKGNYNGFRDCHIEPDWVLIYSIDESMLTLHRTGTHSDLFK